MHRGLCLSEQDDLRQEMYLALLEKTPVYLKHKSGKRTFIDRTLRNVARRYFFDRNLHGNLFTTAVDRFSESGHPTFNDPHGGEYPELDRIYLQLDMSGFMRKFTPRQRRICKQLMSGYRPRRIARHMHTICQTVQRKIRQIRELFVEYDPRDSEK